MGINKYIVSIDLGDGDNLYNFDLADGPWRAVTRVEAWEGNLVKFDPDRDKLVLSIWDGEGVLVYRVTAKKSGLPSIRLKKALYDLLGLDEGEDLLF